MISKSKQAIQYGLGFFPLFHEQYIYYKNGKRFKELYKSLEKTEHFSLEQIRAYQNSHFLNIFHHALKHVPFYRKECEKSGLNISHIQSLDDLHKLPLIEKQTVQSYSRINLKPATIKTTRLLKRRRVDPQESHYIFLSIKNRIRSHWR